MHHRQIIPRKKEKLKRKYNVAILIRILLLILLLISIVGIIILYIIINHSTIIPSSSLSSDGDRVYPKKNHPLHDIANNENGNANSNFHSNTIQTINQQLNQEEKEHTEQQEQQLDNTLRAFLEPIHLDDWTILPLPVRTTTAKDLKQLDFSVLSCKKLAEQWPVNNDSIIHQDAFLPWIHDVFPNAQGTQLQFVAQNKRRCHTGTTTEEMQLLKHNQPQVALFQGVSVKRIVINHDKKTKNATTSTTTTTISTDEERFQLVPHDEADPDGMDTRFICRFKPSNQITLSQHNINYDYAAYRKGHTETFTEKGRTDIKSIHTSQLVFYCPIPENLQPLVKTGESVQNDQATLFVDLIPIRTPPRYSTPNSYLPPRYKEFQETNTHKRFHPKTAWGDAHVLPLIQDSGRWENIPICKPTHLTFPESKPLPSIDTTTQKRHRLVACVWASSGYATRGGRFGIHDGQRRLREWIHFNQLVGFQHFYIYDNSVAHSNQTLQSVTDDYPDITTRIVWPSKVCNNNKNNVDSPGERSSQYAAESSCRLRFGPHVEWIGQFDIDEYLVPMGDYTTVPQLLDTLDSQGKKIISFASWRAWPRRDLIVPPVPIHDNASICADPRPCFHCTVPPNRTILQTYNCDRFQGQKQKSMPAEKQLYRPEYVLQHFVHYSTVTVLSMYNKEETLAAGLVWKNHISVDPLSRFSDETKEGTMLHTKAMATQDTAGWLDTCTGKSTWGLCRIGNPWPPPDPKIPNATKDELGWLYNCYVNHKIDDYYVPKLEKSLMDKIGQLS